MKMLIVAVFVAVALLAGVEAGCGQFGCCYCHKEQGYVINQGQFQSDCDTGYQCVCNHNQRKNIFYGDCVTVDRACSGGNGLFAYCPPSSG